MAQIRILNGNIERVRGWLGDELASKLELLEGDAVLTYDPETEQEEDWVCRDVFEKLITQGHTAFSVDEETGESEIVKEYYNPTEQPLVVMVEMIAGG